MKMGSLDDQAPKKSREVYLFEPISNAALRMVREEILSLFAEDANEPIILMLGSSGGDVVPALRFAELMRFKQVPLTVNVLGEAYSAAITVLCAGKIRRASKLCGFLFHEPNRTLRGETFTARELEIYLQHMQLVNYEDAALIARATGKLAEDILALKKTNRYMTAEEAQKFGLIHEIFDIT